MVERPTNADQIAELSPLTPEHWQDILERFSSDEDKEALKIMEVAQAMLQGNIKSPDLYFGKRHWQQLAFIRTWDEVRTPRRFFLPDKVSHVENMLALETQQFALLKMKLTDETLNDRFVSAGVGQRTPDDLNRRPSLLESNARYAFVEGRWIGKKNEVVDHEPGMGYIYGSGIYEVGSSSVIAYIRWAYKVSEEEIPDVLHTSPEEIGRIITELARANPQNYPRLELPIP